MSEREGEKEKGSGANTSIYLSLYLRGSEGLEGEIGFALPFSDRPTALPQLPGCLPASPPRSLLRFGPSQQVPRGRADTWAGSAGQAYMS